MKIQDQIQAKKEQLEKQIFYCKELLREDYLDNKPPHHTLINSKIALMTRELEVINWVLLEDLPF